MAVFSAKNVRNEFKAKGIFHTNEALAKSIKEKAIKALGYEPSEVLDLCCGSGSLLSVFENATLNLDTHFILENLSLLSDKGVCV